MIDYEAIRRGLCRDRTGQHHLWAGPFIWGDGSEHPCSLCKDTTEQLSEIKARNETRKKYAGHREIEDTFYSCPTTKDYAGNEKRDYCDCSYPETIQAAADIDALLREMDRWIHAANATLSTAIDAINGNEEAKRVLLEAEGKRVIQVAGG
jgi:hypothetical protein